MAYSPTTGFLALLRLTSAGAAIERMPGLDFAVAALARAGLFQFSTGQTPPTANQASTVWLRPAQPSWTAEATVFLWNTALQVYQTATPTLWQALLAAAGTAGYVFQSAVANSNIVAAATSLLAIQRPAPGATAISLPSVVLRGGKPLQIADWSVGVLNHAVTITPAGVETIMQRAALGLLSTAVQLAGVTLYPSAELNGWVIAP